MSWYKILVCVAPNVNCDRRVLTKAKQHTHRCHEHRMHILAKQWVDDPHIDMLAKQWVEAKEE